MKTIKNCFACLLPFSKDKHHQEGSKYCSCCADDKGNFKFKDKTLKEFKEMSYQNMRKNNSNFLKAKLFTFMINFAPLWREKKIIK